MTSAYSAAGAVGVSARRPRRGESPIPGCPDRVRPDADGPRRQLRPLPRAGDDDDVRQPGLDRAADARRVPRRLPLCARVAGGGRGRDGRRLRPGLGGDHARQPPHRARRRQRDGGDLQRAGEPLAAADHRRPAGAGADHPAGEPDQPRRDADAAPAGQVGLRAAAGRGRAPGPGPRRPPGLAAAEGPRLRLAADGRLVRRGRRGRRPRGDRAHGQRSRHGRPRGGALARRAARRRRATRSSSPAPTSTPAGRGTSPSRSPSASACRSGRRPRPAASGSASPRATPTSAACCRRRSARSARPSRATT